MIPLYKLFSLVLRVFSRPLINLTKRYHANNHIKCTWIKGRFLALGTYFHKLQNRINRRYLKMDPSTALKPLSEAQGVEKGIQFFYEILFYSIAIGFPLYELYRQVVDTKAKEAKLSRRVEAIKSSIQSIQSRVVPLCSRLSDTYGQMCDLQVLMSVKYMLFLRVIANDQLDENRVLLRKYGRFIVDGLDSSKYRLL